MEYKPVIKIFDVLKIHPGKKYIYGDAEHEDFVFWFDTDGTFHLDGNIEYVGPIELSKYDELYYKCIRDVMNHPENIKEYVCNDFVDIINMLPDIFSDGRFVMDEVSIDFKNDTMKIHFYKSNDADCQFHLELLMSNFFFKTKIEKLHKYFGRDQVGPISCTAFLFNTKKSR